MMREGWREVRLGDALTRRSDFTPVTADELYRVVGVQRSGWGLVDREPARGDSMKFDKLLELRTDDLVYRTITAFEAPSTVVLPEFEGAFVTPQTFPVYTIDRSQLLPGYMALLTTSPAFHEEMSARCVGTVLRRKTLSRSAFESIPLTLPPRSEQRRIVDLIAAVDDAIEAAEGEAERSIRLLGDVVDVALSEQGDTRAVADLAVQPRGLVGGPFGSSLVRADYREHGVPVIRGVNMPGPMDKEIGGDYVFVDEEKANKLAGNQALPGDVIFTQRGTIGQVGAVPKEPYDRYVVSQSQMRLRVDPLQAVPEYVRFIFTAPSMITRLKAENRATANPHINLGVLAQTRVPVPPVDEQLRLIALWDSIAEAGRTARTHAESLRTLRSNLLAVLLSGEHEIPESYDHLLDLAEEGAAA